MSAWIVDGMNLIGSRPDGWWRDRRGAMQALVAQLERFASAAGEPLTVVFDGRPFDLGGGPSEVEVAFASRRGRDAADDDIAAAGGGRSAADRAHGGHLRRGAGRAGALERCERGRRRGLPP